MTGPGWTQRFCPHCGHVTEALARYIRHVHNAHVEKCEQATPADRKIFAKTGRWPKKT
jgi:uncharacterized C2H2 Zn-finger protein